MNTVLLQFEQIGKRFPGTIALDGVSFDVHSGQVVSILGENGAGKSTLMKILSGVWPHGTYEGVIRIEGELVQFADTRAAHDAGIAMIHQELAIFPELTVAEHLELDQLPAWVDWAGLFLRTNQFLAEIGFPLRAEQKVGELSIGARQLVEIARALYRKAKILVFDEPTSALTEQEVRTLFAVIRQLREKGCGILYITHRMDEIFELSDRMIVMRDGKKVGEANAFVEGGTRVSRDQLEPELLRMMVGRSIESVYPPKSSQPGEVLLQVRELSLRVGDGRARLKNISFDLRRGEVLGFAGLLGAGRSELFDSLFGVLSSKGPRGARGAEITGQVKLLRRNQSPLGRATEPVLAIQGGLAYVTEDRKGSGLVLGQSIRSNFALPSLSANKKEFASGRGWFSLLDSQTELERAEYWRSALRVKCADIEQPVGQLSGGNQQKVVLSKWLVTDPEILILDEPTRGVDVGAKVEIYQWIQNLASQGMAILVASSEMPELLGLSHRILVLREGEISAEFSADEADQEKIMKAASL
jgi:D-xylose transport system ATP-binding protein